MAGLIPFNRKYQYPIAFSTGFDDFYNVLDDFFSESRRNLTRDTFKIDVRESDSEYLIEAELPGVQKEEVELQLDEGRLMISVKREESTGDEGRNYVHRERRVSSMSRSVHLPEANREDIQAKLEHGVLTITVPKAEKARAPFKIEIQ